MTLEQFFKENPVAALGFSGGVDSSYLLYAALHYGAKVKAYFVRTAFQPEWELQDSYRLAKQTGTLNEPSGRSFQSTEITVLEKNILDNAKVVSNPPDRCYFCKMSIFETLRSQAIADGIPLVIDGTNASDNASDRPGMKALAELSIRSPLRECGIAKDEVRRLSKEAGLFTWNKPAYACLATRVPSGTAITKELLERIEKAEDALFALGFTDFRVRVLELSTSPQGEVSRAKAARLQFPQKQIIDVINKRTEIVQAIKPYFAIVLLDLEGR